MTKSLVQCYRVKWLIQGRPIYEMFEVSEPIKRLIMDKSDASLIKKTARAEGMQTLREAAVQKMLDGITSYEQVIAVTREDR